MVGGLAVLAADQVRLREVAVQAGPGAGEGRIHRRERVGLPRAFRTAELVLIHAASCRFRYSLWTSWGVL